MTTPIERPDSLYRNGPFVLFIAIRSCAMLAIQIQSVSVGWQIYDITSDPFALGLVGLSGFAAMAGLILPGGDVADRFPRRFVLGAAYTAAAGTAALYFALSAAHNTAAWPIYVVTALFGVTRAFIYPAIQSIVPNLVKPTQLSQAIALASASSQTAAIGGPVIGGLLYAVGPEFAYGASCGMFVVAAIASLNLRAVQYIVVEPGVSAISRFVAGIGFLWSRPTVLGSVMLDLFAVLLGGVTALLPIYARDILQVGPEGLGALRGAIAAGAAVTGVLLVARPIRRHEGVAMLASVAMYGLATVLFGLSTSFALSLVAMALLGVTDMISINVRQSLVQLATPDVMRGRVSAVNMLFVGASNELGEFRAGISAGLISVVPTVVVGGLGIVAAVGACMWAFPELGRVDRLAGMTPENAPRRKSSS